MKLGTYFNSTTNEIVAVRLSDDKEFPAGNGWVKVTDNPRLGLLLVRDLLVKQKLVKDPRLVYWYGFRGSADGRESDRAFSHSWRRADGASPQRQRPSSSVRSRVLHLLRALFRVRSRYA